MGLSRSGFVNFIFRPGRCFLSVDEEIGRGVFERLCKDLLSLLVPPQTSSRFGFSSSIPPSLRPLASPAPPPPLPQISGRFGFSNSPPPLPQISGRFGFSTTPPFFHKSPAALASPIHPPLFHKSPAALASPIHPFFHTNLRPLWLLQFTPFFHKSPAALASPIHPLFHKSPPFGFSIHPPLPQISGRFGFSIHPLLPQISGRFGFSNSPPSSTNLRPLWLLQFTPSSQISGRFGFSSSSPPPRPPTALDRPVASKLIFN
ncbi:unnamed protein product [Acanthosepion pharaonis]|uniref:Uncharacterized protein n=1 Tax=Acanthosepion pharaonis TaxID=158019 RepID=A0A812C4A2_ACAPH|nr:unnamed protein product [Sepia pharaonis]